MDVFDLQIQGRGLTMCYFKKKNYFAHLRNAVETYGYHGHV